MARINLWTFLFPGLRARREDIELDQYAQKTGRRITFGKEARAKFLELALSADGKRWRGWRRCRWGGGAGDGGGGGVGSFRPGATGSGVGGLRGEPVIVRGGADFVQRVDGAEGE